MREMWFTEEKQLKPTINNKKKITHVHTEDNVIGGKAF